MLHLRTVGNDNWPIFVKGYLSHDIASDTPVKYTSCGNAALCMAALFAVTRHTCEHTCEPILQKLTAVNGWLCPIHFALVPLRAPVTLFDTHFIRRFSSPWRPMYWNKWTTHRSLLCFLLLPCTLCWYLKVTQPLFVSTRLVWNWRLLGKLPILLTPI